MHISDENLREQVSRAWRHNGDKSHPSFDSAWRAAQDHYVASRRHYRLFASAAAVMAAIVVGLNVQVPPDESYIEIAELLGTTYWSAPSDVLLPDREFDLYQDMPVLFESTNPAGGALL